MECVINSESECICGSSSINTLCCTLCPAMILSGWVGVKRQIYPVCSQVWHKLVAPSWDTAKNASYNPPIFPKQVEPTGVRPFGWDSLWSSPFGTFSYNQAQKFCKLISFMSSLLWILIDKLCIRSKWILSTLELLQMNLHHLILMTPQRQHTKTCDGNHGAWKRKSAVIRNIFTRMKLGHSPMKIH